MYFFPFPSPRASHALHRKLQRAPLITPLEHATKLQVCHLGAKHHSGMQDDSGPVHTYPEICENANFFYEYGLHPHVSSVFSGRIRKFLKTLSRVEIFLSDTNTYTCGRSYPQICEYAYVISVFTLSIARLYLLC